MALSKNNILLVTPEAHPSSQQILADLGAIRISSAVEAAEPAAEAYYDLVVVDDQPRTAELVARFHDRYPKLPIVVLSSAHQGPDDFEWKNAREAWRAGATDVVRKEAGEAELSQAVRRILGLTERSILFVDDDVDFLSAWAKLLRDDGYSVATAASPAAALEALASQSFGLAVVDVRLGPSDSEDKSGLQVAAAASRRGIITIVLTANPNFDTLRDAMRKGDEGSSAVDFVYKGEGFATLRDRIEVAFAHTEEH